MFPDDSWCKDTANLKFQDATKTQQICPDHVKQCGYSEIGKQKCFFTCSEIQRICKLILFRFIYTCWMFKYFQLMTLEMKWFLGLVVENSIWTRSVRSSIKIVSGRRCVTVEQVYVILLMF